MAQLLKEERLDLHGNVAKAESSLALQTRTEEMLEYAGTPAPFSRCVAPLLDITPLL